MKDRKYNLTEVLADPKMVEAHMAEAKVLSDDDKIEFTLDGFFDTAKSLTDIPGDMAKVMQMYGMIISKLIM